MIPLLNRIAWILSFSTSFVLLFLLGMYIDVFDGGYIFDDDFFFIWLFITVILSLLVKKIFLSKAFIRRSISSLGILQDEIKEEDQKNSAVLPYDQNLSEWRVNSIKNEEQREEEILEKEEEKTENQAEESGRNEQYIQQKYERKQPKEKTPKEPGLFEKFFSENLLAKVGGILLFLGVLFLLQLVYTKIGPVGKLLVGFSIGFALYGVGVFLEMKKFSKESRALLGTAIVINYLVILAGRYLIGETFTHNMIFSEGLTFLLLICNTIFAIVTSLVYKSKTLLLFAFVFAYFIPFLINPESQNTPYTLLGYSLILSCGAIALHRFLRKESYHNLLAVAAIGGNILILLAPFTLSSEWIIVLGASVFLSLVTLFSAYHSDQRARIAQYFFVAYIALIALLISAQMTFGEMFTSGFFFIGYSLALLLFLGAGVIVFLLTAISSVLVLLATPLLIFIGLVFFGSVSSVFLPLILIVGVLVYLFLFPFIALRMTAVFQYIFFSILGSFLIIITSAMHLTLLSGMVFPVAQTIAVLVSAFLFLSVAYFFSRKKELIFLYSLGTILSIFTVLPVLTPTGDGVWVSVFGVVLIVLMNVSMPFLNKNFLTIDVRNSIIGLLAGALFGAGEIFYFGEQYFSGVAIGLAFLAFAIFYFFLGTLLFQKVSPSPTTKDTKNISSQKNEKESAKNIIYVLLGVSISLFSLAIAFVFSKHSEVVSAVWLFESTVLFFFYQKTRDLKIYSAGMILMVVGLIKLFSLLGVIREGEFLSLIPLSIIAGSLFLTLKFLDFEKRDLRLFHDFGHLAALALLGLLLIVIIPSHHYGWAHFSIALCSIFLAFLYRTIFSGSIKNVFAGALILFFIFHIFDLKNIFWTLEKNNLDYLKVLQYITTAFLAISFFLLRNSLSSETRKAFLIAFPLYFFIITSLFIYDLFWENTFLVTLYWGILAFLSSGYGIQQNIIKYRTLGLSILALTVAKILLYDIWYALDNAVMRIVALMVVGGLMIVISLLYSKKYGDNLKGEFLLSNLFNEDRQ